LHVPAATYGPLLPGPMALDTEDSHYVLNVLRLKPGDAVALFDGTGTTAESVLTPVVGTKRRQASLNVVALGEAPLPCRRLSVALPPPKGERTDWLVEKLTEVGVGAIHWLHTAYSEDQAARLRPQRLDRLISAAARQAGIDRVPVLHAPETLQAFVAALPAADVRWVAHPRAPSLLTLAAAQPLAADITVVVGPEGGLSPAELTLLESHGFAPAGLSAHILRVETAALVAAAALLMT
jgi:16S rRNA (uracil1498-N3)-methyltransferase